MRILQVFKNYDPSNGGVERHIDGICKTINKRFLISFIFEKSNKFHKYRKNYKIFKNKNFNFIKHIYSSDVIHIHGARIASNLKFFIFGKICNKKIIYTPHCYYDSKNFLNNLIKKIWDFSIEKIIYKYSDTVILLNNYWLEYAKKKKFFTRRVKIIPNCVMKKNIKTIKFNKKNNSINILSLSRLDKVKRIDDIINAFSQTDKNNILHIVGNGNAFQKYLTKYKSFKNIKFYGFLNDHELNKLLPSIDVFIIASEKEGMPTTIIEMIIRGIPVIASKIPGNVAILKNLNDKYMFNVGDINKITQIMKNKKFILKKKLQDSVINNFTWEKKIFEIEKIYEN